MGFDRSGLLVDCRLIRHQLYSVLIGRERNEEHSLAGCRASGAFVEEERAIPPLESKQVLVRIAASGINPLDTKIRGVKAAHAQQPLPAVLGLDMAGTVEEVGLT